MVKIAKLTFTDLGYIRNMKSKGLGDTIEKMTVATGIKKLAEKYTQVTGKDCGCNKRKAALNKAFPYGKG